MMRSMLTDTYNMEAQQALEDLFADLAKRTAELIEELEQRQAPLFAELMEELEQRQATRKLPESQDSDNGT